jgi:hypothetical protein
VKNVLPLAILAMLSGCFGNEPTVDPQDCTEPCSELATEPLQLDFTSCIESRFPLDLDRVVYEVPPGFESQSFGSVPQRLYVAMGRCETVTNGLANESDVSLVQIGVFVTAPDRGQGGNADIFGLEIVTDSPMLAAAFGSRGFIVVNGTVDVEDLGGVRLSAAQGDVDYQMQGEFVPFGNGPLVVSPPIPGSVAQHSLKTWYQEDRACGQYFGTAAIQFTANRGLVANAMPAVGPLQGTSSLAFTCDATIQFGNTTIASAE